MKFPSDEFLRLSKNLADAPLADVLFAAALSLESARELLVDLFKGNALDRELLEVTMKPVIRELVKRQLDLENYRSFLDRLDLETLSFAPKARGNA
jgi:hypothetical protein